MQKKNIMNIKMNILQVMMMNDRLLIYMQINITAIYIIAIHFYKNIKIYLIHFYMLDCLYLFLLINFKKNKYFKSIVFHIKKCM